MSKNLTRKGLAFGALVALASSAITGAPASAAGLADNSFVSLAPTTGSQYVTIAEAGRTFSLTANEATTVVGGNLKFLVKDTSGLVQPNYGSTAATLTPAIDDNLAVVLSAADDTITVTDSDLADALVQGDRISLSSALVVADADIATKTFTAAAANTTLVVGAVDTTANTVVIKSNVDILTTNVAVLVSDGSATTLTAALAVKTGAASNVKLLAGPRDSVTTSYVVNSASATSGTSEVLVLQADGTTTRSVEVTAWVDANGDSDIDTTEYASPVRTVEFKKASEFTPSVSFTPVMFGDASLAAKVTVSPTINWTQLGGDGSTWFDLDIKRQGSTESKNGTVSWSNTTGEWTVSQYLRNTTSADVWTDITLPAATGTKYAQSGQTVTITAASHTLKVNDVVSVNAATAGYDENNVKVTAVTTNTFSYTTAQASATVADVAEASTITVASYGYAVAGAYTVDVKIGSTPAKIGSTFSTASAAATAAAVSNKAVVSANSNATFAVRKGTTAASVVTTVKNSAGVAVAAGVPVEIAVTETATGAVTVNTIAVSGSKTISTVTDANGQVKIDVTNASALAGETVQLAVTSQGYSDTDTLTWAAAQYSLVDLRDANVASANVARVVAKNGTVKFDLSVADQFGSALTAESRVKIVLAGTRWSATSYENLTAGKANVVITDAPVAIATLSATVVFTVQTKNTAGSWVDADGNTDVVTDFARANGDLDNRTTTVNVLSANGSKVVLNADTVSSADLSSPVATTAIAASDTRKGEAAVAFSTTVDDSINITGKVVDGFTEVAQDGHEVTVSGPSNVLFRVGAVSATGTLTFISGANADFNISAFSNSAQTGSVITVTANGVSSTVKISFTGVSTDLKKLSITPLAATYVAGQTVVYTILLTDTLGNPVNTVAKADTPAAAYISVSYEGPGIISGSLPLETDADGKASVRIVTGLADVAAAVLTVKYDQNFDGDYVDTTDLTATSTVTSAALANEAASKIGTGNGRVYVNVKNAKGAVVSVKIGSKWTTKTSLSNDYTFSYKNKAGAKVAVKVYVDGDLSAAKTITVK